jgi:hypothetical protein
MMEVRYAGEVFDDLRPSVDRLNSRKPGPTIGRVGNRGTLYAGRNRSAELDCFSNKRSRLLK